MTMVGFASRLAGLLLIAVAMAAVVVDAAKSIATSEFVVTSLGQWWFAVDRVSLDVLHRSVEAVAGGWLWDALARLVLSLPVWLFPGVPGAVLIALAPPIRRAARAPTRQLDRGLT